jgi:hypothetical protein
MSSPAIETLLFRRLSQRLCHARTHPANALLESFLAEVGWPRDPNTYGARDSVRFSRVVALASNSTQVRYRPAMSSDENGSGSFLFLLHSSG